MILLIFAILFTAFSSCSDKDDGTDEPDITVSGSEETQEAATEDDLKKREAISDDLPDVKFNDYEFTIMSRTNSMLYCEHLKDLYVEADETEDVIDEAVYRRNTAVEDRFGIKIKVVVMDAKDETNPGRMFQKSVKAGETTYDMIIDHMIYLTGITTSGIFYNWYDLPGIDFSKPWWVKDATEKLKVYGKSFFALSDLSYNAIDYTYCMFFNKKLLRDYGIEIPYQKVADKEWTLDYLSTVTRDIYSDLNNDAKRDEDDLYGYVSNAFSAGVAYQWALDNPVTRMNADGIPEVALNSEKTPTMIEKLYDLFFNSNGSFVVSQGTTPKGTSWIDVHAISFKNGKAAFSTGMFVNAIMDYRGMDDDFGFLPMPLWDNKQDKYYTMLDGHGPLMAVPVNLPDPERTGTIIEALSAEGYKKITPVYYDVALKTKFVRDEESRGMIDLIMDGRTFDFGYMYDNWNGFGFLVQNMFTASTKTKDFASYYEKNVTKVENYYAKILKFYEEYQG